MAKTKSSNDDQELEERNEVGDMIMEAETTKTIVISGVSRGLGRALALEFAKLGHTIIGCDRDKIKLDSLRLQLSNASPRNHLLFNLDVKSNDSIREMAHTVEKKFGSIDIIVNNAGVFHDTLKFWEIGSEMLNDVIDINIKGVANVLRHFIPLMLPKNKGIIVNSLLSMEELELPRYVCVCIYIYTTILLLTKF
ncbi:hypothetical protein IC575_004396 [Cucumis melo]